MYVLNCKVLFGLSFVNYIIIFNFVEDEFLISFNYYFLNCNYEFLVLYIFKFIVILKELVFDNFCKNDL